ncbi:MAG: TolC family protein [Planctomycetota bacterium]|nr:TolC family protein [Planctomycetota bacterium]
MGLQQILLVEALVLGLLGCKFAPAPHQEAPSRPAPVLHGPEYEALRDGFLVGDVVAEVLRRNPGLKSARADWAAAGHVPHQAIWPAPPMATYSPALEPIETREGPARSSFGIRQAIPFPGKLILRGRIAKREAEVVHQEFLEARGRVVEETKAAVYELAWVYEAIRITEETRSLVRRMEEAAQERNRVGKGSLHEVLKAQMERSRIENDLLSLGDDKTRSEARLIALLDRSGGISIGRPAPIEVRESIPSLEALCETAGRRRPEIAGAIAAIEREESSLSLRKEGYIPDLTLGFQYTAIGGGPDAYGLSFGVTLPIWFTQIRASVKEGEKRLESSRADRREVENRTQFEVRDNHARWMKARRFVQLYQNTLIPQAQQAYRAAEAGYLAAKVDFLDYLDSQRTLLQFQLAYEWAKVEAQVRLAALERVVGEDL